MSDLERMWERQRLFANRLVDFGALTEERRDQLTRDYLLDCVSELMELHRHLQYKPHRKTMQLPSASNVLEEVVDANKYLMTICLLWGVDPAKYVEAWHRKTDVVEQRWRQEFERPFRPEVHTGGVVGVDIDGVLADYPNGYLDWVRRRSGVAIPPLVGHDIYGHIAAAVGPERAAHLKHEFRETGGKLLLPVYPEAKKILDGLRARKIYIILISARPYQQYRRIMADTMFWLQQHQLGFDGILWDSGKANLISKQFPELLCMFEDEIGHASPIATLGIPVMMPSRVYNLNFSHPQVRRYEDHVDALAWVDRLMMARQLQRKT